MTTTSCRTRLVRIGSGMLAALLAAGGLPGGEFAAPTATAQTSTISFSNIPLEDSNDDTRALATGDIDGDGDLDLITGNAGSARLFLNNGTADVPFSGVAPITLEGTTEVVEAVALGDVNGDGRLDLVVGTQGEDRVYVNQGAPPYFGPDRQSLNASQGNTAALALGDVNGDGRLDIITGNTEADLLYLNGGGRQPFASVTPVPIPGTEGATIALELGYVNGDQRLDLIVAAYPVVRLYVNDGQTQPFTGGIDLGSSGYEHGEIVLGDVDRDGDSDLVYTATIGDTSLFWNTGAPGWFSRPISIRPSLPNLGPVIGGADLGDVDYDGDLDLVLTTTKYKSIGPGEEYLLLNRYAQDRPPAHDPAPFNAQVPVSYISDATRRVLFADFDRDGDLDVVSGNFGRTQMYFNHTTGDLFDSTTYSGVSLAADAGTPLATYERYSSVLAVGDIDADRDLDVFFDDPRSDLKLLRNNYLQGGRSNLSRFTELQLPGQLIGNAGVTAASLADVNNDGKVDLIAALASAELVFLSNGTGDPFVGVGGLLLSGSESPTYSLAVGDVDTDGDLDIITGNDGPELLYLNSGGADPFGAVQPHALPGSATTKTFAITLGDLDGNGSIDLVTGNAADDVVYLNDGGKTPFLQPGYQLPRSETKTFGVSLGDVNGDGALDLLTGNAGPDLLYLSSNSPEPFTGAIITIGTDGRSTSALIADLDGDLKLDLAFTKGMDLMFYLNSGGEGQFANPVIHSFPTPLDFADSLAAEDFDLDGDIDLFANMVFWENVSRHRSAPATNPPAVAIINPTLPPPVMAGSPVPVSFLLRDPESDRANVRAFFSRDGGGTWMPAVGPTDAETTNLATSPEGVMHTLTWDTRAISGWSDNTLFRIEARPAGSGVNGLAGSYQRPFTAAVSTPFRLRGSVAQVRHGDGSPAYGALVYRLPQGKVKGALPLSNLQTGAPLASNWRGEVNSRDPFHELDTLVALEPVKVTPKYTLYHTSATPVREGLDGLVVQGPGSQELVVSPMNPLLVFSLTVSLEWDASGDVSFMQQLEQGITRASELLYDWSDGQIALGPVTIGQARAGWESADIQIYASNRLRPNASQGGITTSALTETLTVSGRTSTLVYERGQIRMGPAWNRYGDPGVSYGEDWSRALAHELGHYALYLDETYLGYKGGMATSVKTCPSPMSDPYRPAYSELRTDVGWLPGCADTLAHRSTGRTEWGTITRFYSDLHPSELLAGRIMTRPPNPARRRLFLPVIAESAAPVGLGAPLSDGPTTLPLGLTTFRTIAPAIPVPALPATLIDLATPQGASYEPRPGARAFLLPKEGDRIVDLGTPMVDQVLVRGVRYEDRLCVVDPAGAAGGCRMIVPAANRLTVSSTGAWRPQIRVTSGSGGRTVQVSATDLGDLKGSAVKARLFATDLPITSTAVPREPITLVPQGSGYVGTFMAAEPISEGYVLIWAEGKEEIGFLSLVDFSVGGNPAPKKKPKSRNKKRAPGVSADGQLTVFAEGVEFADGQFFTIQSLPVLPAAPVWATPVGQGYRLDASGPNVLGPKLAVSIGYAEGDVPLGQEQGISVYFLPDGGNWRELPSVVDGEQNEVLAQVDASPGIYALMASLRISLPDKGWNLVYAYPGATQPPATALAAITGKYTAVFGYEDGAADPWRLFAPGAPVWVSDLTAMTTGASYWINTTAPIDAPIKGPDGESTTLNAGSVLAPPPATYYGLLPAGVAAAGLRVEGRVGAAVCGTGRVDATARGFVVHVQALGPDELEGCGVPEAEVQVTLLRGEAVVAVYRGLWDNESLHPVTPGAR